MNTRPNRFTVEAAEHERTNEDHEVLFLTFLDENSDIAECKDCDWRQPSGRVHVDHPYEDPGDGRSQCEVCGKFVWPGLHSCKGVRVAPVDPRAEHFNPR